MDDHCFCSGLQRQNYVQSQVVGAAANLLGTQFQNVGLKVYNTKLHITLKMSEDGCIDKRRIPAFS